MHTLRGGVPWPSSLQVDLLRVGLWDEEPARATWARLRTRFELDDVWDAGTYSLLPLVYRRLVALGVDDPVLPRLKGVHRREWFRNRVTVARLGPLLEGLERDGIEAMVVGGVPLALRDYDELGARTIERAVVLVPGAQASRALQCLGAEPHAGIRSEIGRLVGRGDGDPVELRWHLGAPFVLPGRELQSEDAFRDAAEPFEVAGVATRRLNATDRVLHAIVDGLTTSRGPLAQWCADVAVVLRAAGVDWDRFVDLAESRRLAPLTAMALDYLVATFDVDVPAGVRDRLARVPETHLDRRALDRALSPPPGLRGLLDLGPVRAWRRAKLGAAGAALDAPAFLQDAWHLRRRRDVPPEAIRRAGRRLGRRAVRHNALRGLAESDVHD